MKKIVVACLALLLGFTPTITHAKEQEENTYNVVIEGEDWGPMITKVTLPYEDSSTLLAQDYAVSIKKGHVEGKDMVWDEKDATIQKVYVSDEKGMDTKKDHLTLEFEIHPTYEYLSPFYFDYEAFANSWAEMELKISSKDGTTWTKKGKEFRLGADEFDIGTHVYKDEVFEDIELTYASYEPEKKQEKTPLIIWLHGMGEGGTDPNLVLLGNNVTNLVEDEIQSYYNGAYVLAPQTPTFWLNQGDGNMTNDGSSMYTSALMSLIEAYVEKHPDIDMERIYIGGCSNGGYMTMRMVIDYPEYFAAAFPICEALSDTFISEEDIMKIRHMPIWFTHAVYDELAPVDKTDIPLYKRLKEAGASNVHYTMYDEVIDERYMLEDGKTPYTYDSHFSWVYTLKNDPKTDFDGKSVTVDGKEVSIFEWLSLQKKQPSKYEKPSIMKTYGSLFAAAGLCLIIVFATTRLGKKKKEEECK
ncbi:prolyl oligopeptidase family serine peptidase [Amedibacillus sp. YH-ame6]